MESIKLRKKYQLKLQGLSNFYSLHYNFKPSDIDTKKMGTIIQSNNSDDISLHVTRIEGEVESFKGLSSQSRQNMDCILELHDGHFYFRKTDLAVTNLRLCPKLDPNDSSTVENKVEAALKRKFTALTAKSTHKNVKKISHFNDDCSSSKQSAPTLKPFPVKTDTTKEDEN